MDSCPVASGYLVTLHARNLSKRERLRLLAMPMLKPWCPLGSKQCLTVDDTFFYNCKRDCHDNILWYYFWMYLYHRVFTMLYYCTIKSVMLYDIAIFCITFSVLLVPNPPCLLSAAEVTLMPIARRSSAPSLELGVSD